VPLCRNSTHKRAWCRHTHATQAHTVIHRVPHTQSWGERRIDPHMPSRVAAPPSRQQRQCHTPPEGFVHASLRRSTRPLTPTTVRWPPSPTTLLRTVDVSTSPLPDASTTSMIFGSPWDVVCSPGAFGSDGRSHARPHKRGVDSETRTQRDHGRPHTNARVEHGDDDSSAVIAGVLLHKLCCLAPTTHAHKDTQPPHPFTNCPSSPTPRPRRGVAPASRRGA
jgi:hypothetical protein